MMSSCARQTQRRLGVPLSFRCALPFDFIDSAFKKGLGLPNPSGGPFSRLRSSHVMLAPESVRRDFFRIERLLQPTFDPRIMAWRLVEEWTVMYTSLSDTQPPDVAPGVPPDVVSDDSRIGALFGNYRIVRKLGEGGMGVVYEAEHHKIGRRAAVKLLHRHLAEDSEFALRFLNEARAVNIIRQPGLVEIFEFGQLPDGTLYFVMEYLEGETLRQRRVQHKAPLSQQNVIGLATQITQALTAAHDKGIVHRDLLTID